GAGWPGGGASQRPDHCRGLPLDEARAGRDLARAVLSQGGRHLGRPRAGVRGRGAAARGVPRPPVHRRGIRGRGGVRRRDHARQDQPRRARRPGRLRWYRESLRGHPLPLARDPARFGAGRPRGLGPDGARCHHGSPPPRTSHRGGAVPPGVDHDPARPRPPEELPRDAQPAAGRSRLVIRDALIALVEERRDLTREEAAEAMHEMMRAGLESPEGEQATPAQFGAFMAALRLKGETVAEITGMAQAMREHALRLDVKAQPLLDTAGTGGSKKVFNASTAGAFVAAACGAKVAKHGNRAMTSNSGAADFLEALGAQITLTPPQVAECIEKTGMGFLFAPSFHPAMKFAGPLRPQ